MRHSSMHSIAHAGCHSCAPKEWRKTPYLTGDYDLDATIAHTKNRDMAARLAMYAGPDQSYGPRTSYDRYGAAGGDD